MHCANKIAGTTEKRALVGQERGKTGEKLTVISVRDDALPQVNDSCFHRIYHSKLSVTQSTRFPHYYKSNETISVSIGNNMLLMLWFMPTDK